MASLTNWLWQRLGGQSAPNYDIETMPNMIKVDKYTDSPSKAWSRLAVKTKAEKKVPMDPYSPIEEDKVRFVCLSDTHSRVENNPRFQVPDGDILLHTGDFTMSGFGKDIYKFNEYLGTLPHKHKVVIAGNHDLTFDVEFIKRKRRTFMWTLAEKDVEEFFEAHNVTCAKELMTNCIYLQDSAVEICGIKIYGAPWQPAYGNWAFNLRRGQQCLDKWNLIPEDTDILLTHGPPVGHGDGVAGILHLGRSLQQRVGCVELLNTIQKRVKPKFHVFGHIHEGYGITTDGTTTFINASNCNVRYRPDNPPIVFDYPLPAGHTKDELVKKIATGQTDVKSVDKQTKLRSTAEQACFDSSFEVSANFFDEVEEDIVLKSGCSSGVEDIDPGSDVEVEFSEEAPSDSVVFVDKHKHIGKSIHGD